MAELSISKFQFILPYSSVEFWYFIIEIAFQWMHIRAVDILRITRWKSNTDISTINKSFLRSTSQSACTISARSPVIAWNSEITDIQLGFVTDYPRFWAYHQYKSNAAHNACNSIVRAKQGLQQSNPLHYQYRDDWNHLQNVVNTLRSSFRTRRQIQPDCKDQNGSNPSDWWWCVHLP